MIISASRRTDLPSYYGEWFINRLKAGYVCVRNPFNTNNITRIPLNPDDIDCIVFWTKDPSPFLKNLNFLDNERYKYYFLFTVNPYDKSIERNIRNKTEIIKTFKTLSDRIGKNRVIWRYDPVIFSGKIDYIYHVKSFSYLSQQLENYTEKCIFSFLDQYKKVEKNTAHINIAVPDIEIKNRLVSSFAAVSGERNINLVSCACEDDFESSGKSRCIDDILIERIAGYKIKYSKDSSQRKECLCAESRDIASYNSCIHDCIYCYANLNKNEAVLNYSKYDPFSEMLCDDYIGHEKITEYKKYRSQKVSEIQKKLFE